MYNNDESSEVVTFRNVIDRISNVGERVNVGNNYTEHIHPSLNIHNSLLRSQTDITHTVDIQDTSQYFSPTESNVSDELQSVLISQASNINPQSLTRGFDTIVHGTNTTRSLIQPDITGRSFAQPSNNSPFNVIADGSIRNRVSQGNRIMVPSESSLLSNRLGDEPGNALSYGCISNQLAPLHSNSHVPPVQLNHNLTEQVQHCSQPPIFSQNHHRQVLPRSSIASQVPPVQLSNDFSEQVQVSTRPPIFFSQNPHRQVLPSSFNASQVPLVQHNNNSNLSGQVQHNNNNLSEQVQHNNNNLSEQVQLYPHPPNVPRIYVQGHTLPESLATSQANQGYPQYAPSQNYGWVNEQNFIPPVHSDYRDEHVQSRAHVPQHHSHYYGREPYAIPQSSQHSNSAFSVVSNHILETQIITKSIEKFDGTAHKFYPWVDKIQEYASSLNLTPMRTLQLWESYTEGGPQKMISRARSSMGQVTQYDIDVLWRRLGQRYASPQQISSELRSLITNCSPIRGQNIGDQLLELLDICQIISFNKNCGRCPQLVVMDLADGIKDIREKLPAHIQTDWSKFGQNYENRHGFGNHPPFEQFIEFLERQATAKSNKNYEILNNSGAAPFKKNIRAMQTDVPSSKIPKRSDYQKSDNQKPTVPGTINKLSNIPYDGDAFCIYHKLKGHNIFKCVGFKKLAHPEKIKALNERDRCIHCTGNHDARSCNTTIKCKYCQGSHINQMHPFTNNDNQPNFSHKSKPSNSNRAEQVFCTKVCNGDEPTNCSKTVLVELTMEDMPQKSMMAYAIIDEQSNTTLVDDRVVEYFGKEFPTQEFSIKFASQDCEMATSGKVVSGLKIRGVNEQEVITISEALSCPNIADTTKEVATPSKVRNHPYISQFAKYFPEFNDDAKVLILLGRNCGRAMATECLTNLEPYIHKGPLGFSVVGNMCLNNVNSTNPKILRTQASSHDSMHITLNFNKKQPTIDDFETFAVHSDDDTQGLSSDNRLFMFIMQHGVNITDLNYIELPLPLKWQYFLPDNKAAIYMRSRNTLNKLRTQPVKLTACIESMQKSLDAGYVEQISISNLSSTQDLPSWYLPIFCAEQESKNKFRLVYDAAAKCQGTSLNDVLLQGPDFNNQLRTVLLRFREKPIGFGADIKSMFNNFRVPEDQKHLLRFYWYKDNIAENDIVPYVSNSHIFGCTSSPAVANFGLKFCASQLSGDKIETRDYIENSFYVDDGFHSSDSPKTAIKILSETMSLLKNFNIMLHKIVSNSSEVVDHFPDASRESPSLIPSEGTHSSTLGVSWDTQQDVFMITPNIPTRPFTKRGILSTINSLYDPLGLASPVILQGRLIQREILMSGSGLDNFDWDVKLPQNYYSEWSMWISSLSTLSEFRVSRSLYPKEFRPVRQELHTFSDASEKAIGHISFMRSINEDGKIHVCFITASSKLCPRAATTMPRLELCAAMEAGKAASMLYNNLSTKPDAVYLHTDSMIVIGYLSNKTKHFSKYVERRVSIINNLFPHKHWHYVPTKENPADHASRPQTPSALLSSNWFDGPAFLWENNYSPDVPAVVHSSDLLPEEKVTISTMLTNETSKISLLSETFKRVSSFTKLINIATILIKFARKIDRIRQRKGISLAPRSLQVTREEGIQLLVRVAQRECYSVAISVLTAGRQLVDNHKLAELSPQMDSQGIIHVGGRLKNVNIEFSVKHPYLIPGNHPLSISIISYFHDVNKHQGIHISHSAVIQAGFFLENGRRTIQQFISTCITCRKLRGATSTQIMADLPSERLENVPIFSHIGLDVFGPWYVHDGKATRRTSASKKIWALIIVCMPSRAIHLEPLHGMDTSSFRNALSRFMSIRGSVLTIRSDNGTNFLCAKKQIESLDIDKLSTELENRGIQWTLNPPHCSHHGGSWERKIGSVRRVLEATVVLTNNRFLSRDEFTTFLSESASIVNNTPLWATSTSPDDPTPITPNMLLTMRSPGPPTYLDSFSEDDMLAYGQRRYRRVLYLSDQFWLRWRTEYLHTLNARHKWKTKKPCIAPGDVVLIRDKNLPRNQWSMGRVINTRPSKDGLVRSVTILIPPLPGKKETRTVVRGITDLVLLIPSESHPCFNSAQ